MSGTVALYDCISGTVALYGRIAVHAVRGRQCVHAVEGRQCVHDLHIIQTIWIVSGEGGPLQEAPKVV